MQERTREVNISGLKIGNGNPVAIQSMTNTDTRDVNATVEQIKRLTAAGCELVRVAVPDMAAANAIADIKRQICIPLAADIHFDYRLALTAMENGADKLRLNPGNINADKVRTVADIAKDRGIPIRIGVNSGSLARDILNKYGGITAEGLVESALAHVNILEQICFDNIVISLKSSSVPLSIKAYELLSQRVDYPLHVGITEAGSVYRGSIKSAAGIGAILSRGIGDTIRVSLTGDPVEEVRCAKEILKAFEIRSFGPVLISCPTCGRTEIDLVSLAAEVERYCDGLDSNIKVAVMGCAVNGPGEARDADIGIAGGKASGLIFKKGKIVRKVDESELLSVLKSEIDSMTTSERS